MPYLDGWCLAGMRDDLWEIGGFDEDFDPPAYFEDNDLCLRARMAGMTLREVRVPLHHIRNATMKPDDPRVRAATLANRERFMARAREALTLAD
jgi:GT2 family glycosyltransferase